VCRWLEQAPAVVRRIVEQPGLIKLGDERRELLRRDILKAGLLSSLSNNPTTRYGRCDSCRLHGPTLSGFPHIDLFT
jgi:hypothetical protein